MVHGLTIIDKGGVQDSVDEQSDLEYFNTTCGFPSIFGWSGDIIFD